MNDFDRLAADLLRAGLEVTAKGSLLLVKTAYDIEADAKAFCPVDTGNLQGSIGSSPIGQSRGLEPGDLDAEIGPTAEYGEYVEGGTARQAPQAYMGPAFDRRAPGFVAGVEQLGGDIL